MCGIVGYIGKRHASEVIINGLRRLEYRGYDSTGLALYNEGKINIYKKASKVDELAEYIKDKDTKGTIGIGHTRWATHGLPNDKNAHPHHAQSGDITIIHNGIIENYDVIKEELIKRNYQFYGETDTEILVNFIEHIQKTEKLNIANAVRMALTRVVGAYAIIVLSKKEPNTLVAARKGSPMVIGLGNKEYFIASDATPIIEYTKNVIYLDDDNIAIIQRDSLTLKTINNEIKTPNIKKLDISLESIEKGNFKHFMLKEIFEQPTSIKDTMRGRVKSKEGVLKLGGLINYMETLKNAKRIILVSCGTSWHAALVAEYIFESLIRIPVEVEYGSEFRYRNPVIYEDDVIIAISQSGETADTLSAVKMVKNMGATTLGICNVVGSSIARETDAGIYTHAGPEIGVASTKAFTSQLVVLYMIGIKLAYEKGIIDKKTFINYLHELDSIPDKIEKILELEEQIKEVAKNYKDSKNALYLGRGNLFPIALEGALKLKEISYIHAEGYPAAEMKHGPIALIDEEMAVVVVANNKIHYQKVSSNIEEVKSRKGKIIAIVKENDKQISQNADHVITIPQIDEIFTPILGIIPLQIFAYHIAVMRGCNVDQPRNLAKSVTVE